MTMGRAILRMPGWRLLAAVAAVLLTLLLAGVCLVTRDRPRAVNPTNASRIQRGMTRGEVEAILGGLSDLHQCGWGNSPNSMWRRDVWAARDGVVTVWFDGSDRVTLKSASFDPDRGQLAVALEWARRQWQRWFP
jgi:hypothetical protein